VVTGAGSGMGRELVRQLAEQGCAVAACDWNADSVAEVAGDGVTAHVCDVSDEAQVLRFRDELLAAHGREHVDLVFSNAGVGGGGSFVTSSRQEWERTFAVDWWGVYHCARAFLPLLIASGDGVLVNTSSVNGLWASLGPGRPNTAYSAAKFAVRGFTEGLIEDLRTHAPQVRVVLVLPGHVGTDIVANTRRAHGLPEASQLSDAEVERLIPAATRAQLVQAGLLTDGISADDLRRLIGRLENDFRDKAPLSAARAATIILDGVRSGAWRILVGDDAAMIDARVRANPEAAYDYAELFRGAGQSLPDCRHPAGPARCQQDMHILPLLSAVTVSAVTVSAVTVSAAMVATALAVTSWHPAELVPLDAAPSSAPYYVIDAGLTVSGGAGVAVVDGFTGTTVATVLGPGHRPISVIGAADDDRTFILATTASFYELRLESNGKPEWLTAVRGKLPPAGIGSQSAVSPDGRLVAYTTASGIKVGSLVTGASRSWTTGSDGTPSNLSWAGDRYLAFELGSSIRELDTWVPGHSLLSSRVLPVKAPASDGMLSGLFNPLITPDGSKLFAAAWTGPAGTITAEIEEFSVRTGKLIGVVMPPAGMAGHGDPCQVVWTDRDGTHLMADCGTDAIISDGVRTSASLSLPDTSGTSFGSGLAW
jgi:NAD(P)-dependent dehydrogenase (short-subunit alcohol dehydrogenase family)